jgi:hypothetical protein
LIHRTTLRLVFRYISGRIDSAGVRVLTPSRIATVGASATSVTLSLGDSVSDDAGLSAAGRRQSSNLNDIFSRMRKALILPPWICISCSTTSAMRRSRKLFPARSTVAAASSHDSSLVPTNSITL